MTAAYDAGALIAIDRDDRAMWAYHRRLLEHGRRPVTTAPVVSQVSRSPRQSMLHRLLATCRVVGFDADDAGPVGALLAAADTSDVVDAHLVHIAHRYDAIIVTSDPGDIAQLASHLEPVVRHRRI